MGGAHHTVPTPAMGCPCCGPCVTGLQEAWTEEGATPSSPCHWACGQESGHSVMEGTRWESVQGQADVVMPLAMGLEGHFP